MKIIERRNNEIVEIKKIETIADLDNSVLVLIERGDKIKKAVKGGRIMFSNKNLMSVKSMREAIAENSRKASKKNNAEGYLCCVCSEWFPHSKLDEKQVCKHCQLS